MAVEVINLGITQSQRFWLQPGFALTVSGVGSVRSGVDNISRIRLRPEVQALGPFMDRVDVEISADGDVSYSLYDLNNIDPADLVALNTLAIGTRAWAIYGNERFEHYWDGATWAPKSWSVVGSGPPDDGDARPDGTLYFQIP